MNDTPHFPDTLRVGPELDWVYTSSSRVAQVFSLPHEDIAERILALVDHLDELGNEVEGRSLRYGLLTYQGQALGKGDFEILLSQDLFELLASGFEGKAALS